ncbi:cilia- and flagella-associated protein 91-like [Centruroides vittatus]|uniref:cilia- and flagella-associated protein 91-like n=1 Tax=Centruroides vittatus TaxID=120091 RepID=UPI00350F88DE
MVSCVKEKQMSTLIPGADRWKYIQQPILSRRSYDIGELGSLTLPIKLSSTLDYTLCGPYSQATQTKFRDEETQTEPWNPPYFVYPTSIDPEVLMIKNLKHGDGLPAGQLEIDMIDRLRKRKVEEELLLCLEKQNRKLALEKRFKIIERQEREDWLIRENEIELLQQNDIEKFEKALSDKYKYLREKKFQQLINKWIECEKSKNEKFEKLQRNAYRGIMNVLQFFTY